MKFYSSINCFIISGAFASFIDTQTPQLSAVCGGVTLINASEEDANKFEYAATLVTLPREIQYLCHYVKVYNNDSIRFKASAIAGLEKSLISEITFRNQIAQYAPKISSTCTSFQLIGRSRQLIEFAEAVANIGELKADESASICKILEQSLSSLSENAVISKLSDLKDKLISRVGSRMTAHCSVADLAGFAATEEDLVMFTEINDGLGDSYNGRKSLCQAVVLFRFDPTSARKNFNRLLVSVRGKVQAMAIAPKVANECYLEVNLAAIPAPVLLAAEQAYANGSGDETIQICQVLGMFKENESASAIESLGYLKKHLEDYALARGSF